MKEAHLVVDDRNVAVEKVQNVGDKQFCFTEGCVKAAADLMEKMDKTANPCEDFYQFACGGYMDKTVIPDDRTRTSMFSEVGDKLNEQVKNTWKFT